MFPGNITVFRTYGKRRSNRDIRKAVICQNLLDEITTNFCGRNTLVHIKVKHRTAGIFGLQARLQIQRFKRIIGITDRKL